MILRYWRAFWIALRLTLRGQTIAPSPLRMWLGKTVVLLKGVHDALTKAGVDMQQKLLIDRREMRLQTVLDTVRFHAGEEYPSLLRSGAEHSLAAIQAGTINDRYWIEKCLAAESLQEPTVQAALQALHTHLEAIPTSEKAAV